MAEQFWHHPGNMNRVIDDISSNSGIGSTTSGPAKAFKGFNHQQQQNIVPMNKDQVGYTFFTRPLMNMTQENLLADRRMSLLLSPQPTSYARYIRSIFDHNTMQTQSDCPLLDNYQAFIPILTNFIESSSGWPDAMAQTYTAPEGKYKESFSFVDGPLTLYSTYDITCTFRNILGDPITDLFYYWLLYPSLVFEDRLVCYPRYWWDNEIDYQTRIYRLVMDQHRRYVRRILVANATFPLNAPMGQQANFERGIPFMRENDMLSIQFRTSGGVTYNDPILIDEFNATVVMFNPSMRQGRREQLFRPIPMWARNRLNGYGYPRIDPITSELEWWVSRQLFYQVFTPEEAMLIDPVNEPRWREPPPESAINNHEDIRAVDPRQNPRRR